ncbi:uncharacterized protein [Eschrichtius robustus]|uniref:uncharacterized protein n=1 Tax=Eschrichtius robustus TaxID=9764 RepID=UPI0035C1E066
MVDRGRDGETGGASFCRLQSAGRVTYPPTSAGGGPRPTRRPPVPVLQIIKHQPCPAPGAPPSCFCPAPGAPPSCRCPALLSLPRPGAPPSCLCPSPRRPALLSLPRPQRPALLSLPRPGVPPSCLCPAPRRPALLSLPRPQSPAPLPLPRPPVSAPPLSLAAPSATLDRAAPTCVAQLAAPLAQPSSPPGPAGLAGTSCSPSASFPNSCPLRRIPASISHCVLTAAGSRPQQETQTTDPGTWTWRRPNPPPGSQRQPDPCALGAPPSTSRRLVP